MRRELGGDGMREDGQKARRKLGGASGGGWRTFFNSGWAWGIVSVFLFLR